MKNGIEITPETSSYTYTNQAVSYAKSSIYTLLYNFEAATKEEEITQEKIDKLHIRAQKIEERLPRNIDQEKYFALFNALNMHSEGIADGLRLLKGDDREAGFQKLKEAYLAVESVVDYSYIGAAAYETVIIILEEKYDAQIKAYEASGKQYMLDKANEYLEYKNVFENEIGVDNISNLIKFALFFGDLYYGGAFEGDRISSFTDEEVLIFIKNVDLSKVTVTERGYEIILSIYGDTVLLNNQKTFFDKVIFKATQNGDVAVMAGALKSFIELGAKVQEKLTLDDVALLREGEAQKVLVRCIGRLDRQELYELDRACKQKIDKDAYTELAKGYYGADFSVYLEASSIATIDDLIEACGNDSFNKTLKEYIFGICPAFSYNMSF